MRFRRAVWPALATVVLIGVLFVGVFPTRTWLAQQRSTVAAEEQLAVLDQENARLAARVEALQSDEEIERLAREQYNLVRPGEEAYAVLPPSGSSPEEHLTSEDLADDGPRRSFPSKVWRFLTGWI